MSHCDTISSCKKNYMEILRKGSGPFSAIPVVTKNIIIINFIMWVATIVFKGQEINLTNIFGLHFFKAPDFNPVQLFTYMFMHDTSSFGHIFFNMFAVFMFGRTLELVWGAKRFLFYYIVTGLGAAVVQEITWYISLSDLMSSGITQINLNGVSIISLQEYLNLHITIGASGAVFGILLAFGMIFPNVPLFIMFIPIPVKAKYFVIFYGLAELFLGVSSFSGDNVAHFAHLGGMLFGLILILIWRRKVQSNNDNFRF